MKESDIQILQDLLFTKELNTVRELLQSVYDGDVKTTTDLIESGADVNRGFDKLPLHIASEKGYLEVIRVLLDAGADIEGYTEDYWTPLMAATGAGKLSVVQTLVKYGADINAWSQGETPLMIAARRVHREIYDYLYPLVSDEIRRIGDRDAEKEMARTIRQRARKSNKEVEELIDAVMYGRLKQVEELIEDGVDINTIGSYNSSPLSVAIKRANIQIMQILLDAGANPNLPNETEYGLPANSPLMEAASFFFDARRDEMIQLLIKRGADLNQQDNEGRTALMLGLDYPDVIEILIKAGADLNIRNNEGNTALMQAEYLKLSKTASILKQAGALQDGLKEVELLDAVDRNDVGSVKRLLQEKIDVNLRILGNTALCKAAQKGLYEISKLLITAGADVNQRSSEGYFNPLLNAAYGGHLEVVKVLLEAGADIHVRVKDFWNPLEYAELGKLQGNNKDGQYDEVIMVLLELYVHDLDTSIGT